MIICLKKTFWLLKLLGTNDLNYATRVMLSEVKLNIVKEFHRLVPNLVKKPLD
jgi:hypothetical protein